LGSVRKAGDSSARNVCPAAAKQWSADKKDCRAENGAVIPRSHGATFDVWPTRRSCSNLPEIGPDAVSLKGRRTFVSSVSRYARRYASKVDGSAKFGIDVKVPNMLYAVIARCPHFGGKLLQFRRGSGQEDSGFAQFSPSHPLVRRYPAIWRPQFQCAGGGPSSPIPHCGHSRAQGPEARLDKDQEGRKTNSLRTLLEQRRCPILRFIAVDQGDAGKALGSAPKKIEATYELPFYAPMPPWSR